MKKIKKLCLLSSLLLLVGCQETNDIVRLYKSTIDGSMNGKMTETLKESETSEKDITYTVVYASPDEEEDYSVKASDFKVKANDTEYTCKYFIISTRYSSVTVSGEAKTLYYIENTSNTKEIKHGNVGENLLCAFDYNIGESFSIYYQNTELKFIGEQ